MSEGWDGPIGISARMMMALDPGEDNPALTRLVESVGGISDRNLPEIIRNTLEAIMVRIEAIEKWQEEENRRNSGDPT